MATLFLKWLNIIYNVFKSFRYSEGFFCLPFSDLCIHSGINEILLVPFILENSDEETTICNRAAVEL
jgi:hypothetical protein